MPELSVVIPTYGRVDKLRKALDRLASQTAEPGSFEVIVVADAQHEDQRALESAVAAPARPYRLSVIGAERPGASAARNSGWRRAASPLILFIDDDILAERALVAEHLRWHEQHPDETVGVLGHVRWARSLRVTPFMRWLEHGIQFDYPSIQGDEAGWGRFYTANASLKRRLVERSGGFDEVSLPFGYEDLDLAYRLSRLGFRLLYNRAASAEHLHPMTLDFWLERMPRIAASERTFCRMHPEIPPYFLRLFSEAAALPPARGRGARLLNVVPKWVPWLGPRVWRSADLYYRQALAPEFLAAWERSEPPPAGSAASPGSR